MHQDEDLPLPAIAPNGDLFFTTGFNEKNAKYEAATGLLVESVVDASALGVNEVSQLGVTTNNHLVFFAEGGLLGEGGIMALDLAGGTIEEIIRAGDEMEDGRIVNGVASGFDDIVFQEVAGNTLAFHVDLFDPNLFQSSQAILGMTFVPAETKFFWSGANGGDTNCDTNNWHTICDGTTNFNSSSTRSRLASFPVAPVTKKPMSRSVKRRWLSTRKW